MMIRSDAHHVILRDLKESDITDYIRWMTKPMSWMDFDAPWEDAVMSKELVTTRYHQMIERQEKQSETDRRSRFEIDTKEGVHIGWVTTYQMMLEDPSMAIDNHALAIGIDLPEEAFWGQGYGTSALSMMMTYLRSHDLDHLYLQTWSGNHRMIKVAMRLGFVLCRRVQNERMVSGSPYGGLTFVKSLKTFEQTSFAKE